MPKHPHPVATRINTIIEESERIHAFVESIPTTHIGSKRKGGYRASANTIARNQVAESLELAAGHLARARTAAMKLR